MNHPPVTEHVPRRTARFLSAGVLFAGSLTGGLLIAGPLDPPAGPITPTFKTLTEVEPRTAINAANTPGDADSLYKITQPGSYYLTGNLTGVPGKHGIEIVVGGVTLDLRGFDVAGVPGMGAFDGISVTVSSLHGIAVVNGSVRGWGDGGVDLGFVSNGCRVQGVQASGNAGNGINGGVACTITNCTATANGQSGVRANNGSTVSACSGVSNAGSGILVTNGCVIAECSLYFNGAGGVRTGLACTVSRSTAFTNTGDGIFLAGDSSAVGCAVESNTLKGINAGTGCTLTGCTAIQNTQDGIAGADGVTVTGCTSRANSQKGFALGNYAVLENCVALSNNGVGISCGTGLVTNCTAGDNTVGISVTEATVQGCMAHDNSGDGIVASDGSQILDNRTDVNGTDGIRATSFCLIRGNNCYTNGIAAAGGAGIHTTGFYNRIEANTCTRTDRGIDVDAQANIIIRNTCGFNLTNWTIAANNDLAPIVLSSTNAAPVSGSSYSGNLGSSDPNANFTIQ